MNNDIARLVIAACNDLGLEVRSYSGRGMYGRSCVGVTTDGNSHTALAQIVIALCEQGADGVEAADHFTRSGAIASDSMGLGMIVYFPRLPWLETCDCGDVGCDKSACQDEEPDSGVDEAVSA